MVKEPRPGKVKTRLGNDIGMIESAWWYRHQSLSLIRNVVHPKWETVIAVSQILRDKIVGFGLLN